jgi:hypothetical protein
MNSERLGDNFADSHAGIQGREGVLKDHLHLAPLGPKFVSAKGEQVAAFETNFAAVGFDEAEEHAGQRCFAAAAFSYDGEGFAARNRKTNTVHGGKPPAF